MKIFDPKRHLPVGWDWEELRANLSRGHLFSSLTMLVFLARYSNARSALYKSIVYPDGTLVRELIPGGTIVPFSQLMTGLPFLGMWCYLLLMCVQVWRHYSYHTRDSMAVYTMRRLPDPFELHRRCWTLPLLSAVAELLLFGVLTLLCAALWWFATPAPCRPV